MRVLVLQIEDRHEPLRDLLLAYNAFRAAERGLAYELDRSAGATLDHPPYWRKVFAMRDRLRTAHDDLDAILWLDSDAFLGPRDPRTLLAQDPQHSMWISVDNFPYTASFCAGAFLVRNDAEGRRLLEAWCGLYRPEQWTKRADGRWQCSAFMVCMAFAGPAYEQGSFTDHLLHDPRVRRLPAHVLNAVRWSSPPDDTVAVHLAGAFRDAFRDVVLASDHRRPCPVGLQAKAMFVLVLVVLLVVVAIMYRRR